jgi:hypothetical protein
MQKHAGLVEPASGLKPMVRQQSQVGVRHSNLHSRTKDVHNPPAILASQDGSLFAIQIWSAHKADDLNKLAHDICRGAGRAWLLRRPLVCHSARCWQSLYRPRVAYESVA